LSDRLGENGSVVAGDIDTRRRCIGWPERCVLGGWLLVEEVDGRSMIAADSAPPLADGFNATTQKRLRALHDRGIIDGYLGGLLPRLLTEAGLRDVTHEGIARIVSGGSAWSTHLQETWRLIDSGFVEEGHVDPSFDYRDLTLDAAWGRRDD
jgi:hypothetical protein